MTIGDHIKQLFSGFRLPLNDAALFEIGSDGLNVNQEYSDDAHDRIMLSVLRFAPILMLSPSSYSVSENGHSKSIGFNADGFLRWYSLMCKRYGIADELNSDKPKIKFL